MSSMSVQCLSCNKYLYYTTDRAYSSTTSNAYVAGPCWTTIDNGRHYRTTNGPGNCKECYEKARHKDVALETKNKELGKENKELKDNVDELKANVDELKANVDFLRLSSLSSHDDHPRSSPLSSDVTLVASDDSPDAPIFAHKFVLASRSLVFKAMLETTMEESISGTIKISEVTRDSLHAFVNYLYTAEVCLDEKIASDLLALADKYQIKQLNELCQRYLIPFLNWDNSISYYAFAYKHSAEKLLESSLSIITKNMDKFINSDDYRDLAKKDPSFLVGIFEDYTKKQLNATAKCIYCRHSSGCNPL